jgi:thiol-disulfide isomerase/thioredoxin
MQTLSIGPLAFSADRLLVIALIGVFFLIAGQLSRRWKAPFSDAATGGVIVGILAARAGWVLANPSAYLAEPLSILAIWQGGFSAPVGVLAAAAFTAWRTRPGLAMLALPVTAGILAGVFALTSATLLRYEPQPFPSHVALRALDGSPANPGAAQAGGYVVNLWASWCGPCRREMPMMMEEAEGAPVPVYFVNQGEAPAAIEAYLERAGLPAERILLDPASGLGAAIGSRALPVTLFVGADGAIVDVHTGEISRAAFAQGLRRLER